MLILGAFEMSLLVLMHSSRIKLLISKHIVVLPNLGTGFVSVAKKLPSLPLED